MEVRRWRKKGRRTGRHCTMIVPTISEEYQMFECAFRQKYHSSLIFPSSFQFVRTAAMIATIIPKLIVAHRPIFSTFRMSSFQVMIHGKAARTKSMMMLYTVSNQFRGWTKQDLVHLPFPPSLKSSRNLGSRQISSRYQTS